MYQIGISLASLVNIQTLSSIRSAMWAVGSMKEQVDFIGVLPIKRLIEAVYIQNPKIVYWEDAWSHYGLSNRVLFHRKERSEAWAQTFDQATRVGHYWHHDCALEISPLLGNSSYIVKRLDTGLRDIVLDTCHLRKLDNWQKLLFHILDVHQHRIKLIHVQPQRSSDEYRRFMQNEECTLKDIVRAIVVSDYRGDWLIEVSPVFHSLHGADKLRRSVSTKKLVSSLIQFEDRLRTTIIEAGS